MRIGIDIDNVISYLVKTRYNENYSLDMPILKDWSTYTILL